MHMTLIRLGNMIVNDMIGKFVFTYKFKQKDWAKTLGNTIMKIAPDHTIDTAVLFQCFLMVSKGHLSLASVWGMSSFSLIFFETRNIISKADKPQLAQATNALLLISMEERWFIRCRFWPKCSGVKPKNLNFQIRIWWKQISHIYVWMYATNKSMSMS